MKLTIKISSLLIVFITAISCGNDQKQLKEELKNSTETVKNVSKVVKESENMKENILHLREITPLTKEEFESWLPETVLNLPIANTNINFMHGLSSCGVTYRESNKSVQVMVIDGAGEKGAGGVGPYRMSSKMDYDEEDEWGYSKSRVIDGIKMKESYRKTGDAYTLSMFYADRFAVSIKTNKVTREELEQIISDLKLDKLKNL